MAASRLVSGGFVAMFAGSGIVYCRSRRLACPRQRWAVGSYFFCRAIPAAIALRALNDIGFVYSPQLALLRQHYGIQDSLCIEIPLRHIGFLPYFCMAFQLFRADL